MAYGTKTAIKSAYISGLEAAYDWAKPGSLFRDSGLDKASFAADAALAGKIKLEGEVWFAALAANGVHKGASRAQIAALDA